MHNKSKSFFLSHYYAKINFVELTYLFCYLWAYFVWSFSALSFCTDFAFVLKLPRSSDAHAQASDTKQVFRIILRTNSQCTNKTDNLERKNLFIKTYTYFMTSLHKYIHFKTLDNHFLYYNLSHKYQYFYDDVHEIYKLNITFLLSLC